jgi:hypothetical protein
VICQHATCNGPALTGESFSSGVEVTASGMIVLLSFMKIYQLIKKLIGEDSFFPSGTKVG